MAHSQQSKDKQQQLGGSLSTLFKGLNGLSAKDLMHRDCCLDNPAIVKGCIINNPEDCFEANRCEQCPDNKNHG
jgi:hypothetical protein